MEYKVFLYSRSGEYPFDGIAHDWTRGNTVRLSRGVVKLDKCAGVEYDTQIADYSTGEPLDAFCSEDDYYFVKTEVLLDYLKTSD